MSAIFVEMHAEMPHQTKPIKENMKNDDEKIKKSKKKQNSKNHSQILS